MSAASGRSRVVRHRSSSRAADAAGVASRRCCSTASIWSPRRSRRAHPMNAVLDRRAATRRSPGRATRAGADRSMRSRAAVIAAASPVRTPSGIVAIAAWRPRPSTRGAAIHAAASAVGTGRRAGSGQRRQRHSQRRRARRDRRGRARRDGRPVRMEGACAARWAARFDARLPGRRSTPCWRQARARRHPRRRHDRRRGRAARPSQPLTARARPARQRRRQAFRARRSSPGRRAPDRSRCGPASNSLNVAVTAALMLLRGCAAGIPRVRHRA